MAAVKITSAEQHQLLHQRWPDDCCLCRADERIIRLEQRLAEIEKNTSRTLRRLDELADTLISDDEGLD